jgi:hypothetical protein
VERAGVVDEVPNPKVLARPSEQGRAGVGHVLEFREFESEVLEGVVAGAEDGDRPGGAAIDLAGPQRWDQPCQGQRRLSAARRPQDGQEPPGVARLGHRRQAMAQQPVNLRLAAEEEQGVILLEHFEAAIRTFALEDPLAPAHPGWDAPDATDEVVESLLVVERPGELDPRRAKQEAGQPLLARARRPRQQDRDDPVSPPASADAVLDRRPQLLVLPGAEAPRPDEDCARGALDERLLDRLLPGVARDQVPFVEEGLDPVPHQPPGELLDGGLVRAAMREEDLIANIGWSGHERHLPRNGRVVVPPFRPAIPCPGRIRRVSLVLVR